jgi:hypothetical protein
LIFICIFFNATGGVSAEAAIQTIFAYELAKSLFPVLENVYEFVRKLPKAVVIARVVISFIEINVFAKRDRPVRTGYIALFVNSNAIQRGPEIKPELRKDGRLYRLRRLTAAKEIGYIMAY